MAHSQVARTARRRGAESCGPQGAPVVFAGGEITASEDFRLLFRRRARFRPVAHGPETAAVRAALPLAPADVATTPGLGVSTTGMGPTSAEPRSAHRALGRCCDGLHCAPFEQVPPVCGHPGRSSPPPWACMWAMPPPSYPNPSSGVCVCPTASHRHTPWSPFAPRCQGSNRRPCAAPPSQLLRRPCIPYLS